MNTSSQAARPHQITLRFLAAPMDVGLSGTVEAGTVLEWVDKAAYAAAVGWARSYAVTAYVGNIHFAAPVRSGDLVEVTASIVYTGTSSMHVHTEVHFRDLRGAGRHTSTTCLVIFVAVDERGTPHPVPEFVPATQLEIERREHALARIEIRDAIVAEMKDQRYTAAGTAENVVLRFMAEPTDVNWGGKVHGGTVMKWIDTAAALCASRYCGRDTVAVFSGGIRFYRPLLIGDLVEVEARLVYTGHKGMHIAVHVRSGDPKQRQMNLTTYCLTVMVARDETGTAVPVPRWEPVSGEDQALWTHARNLLAIRANAPGGYTPSHLHSAPDAQPAAPTAGDARGPAFVKICGLSTAADVATAVAHGADALGFVLTTSPREVSPAQVARLVADVPDSVATVGVFRDEPADRAIELARAAGLGWIQLHGPRTRDDVAAVHAAGFKVIRAVRRDAAADEFADWGEDLLLVDAAVPGSGEAWDYAAVRPLAAGRTWLVAGGLEPANVAQALELSGASGADVSSGVESARGVKDPVRIIDFIAAARATAG